jgi:hypothetical protein
MQKGLLEPHEEAFRRRHPPSSAVLKQLDRIRDDMDIVVLCANRLERAIVHTECKARGLFSARTEPGSVAGVCVGCQHRCWIEERTQRGFYYYGYGHGCPNKCPPAGWAVSSGCPTSIRLDCPIQGVRVSAKGPLPMSKTNARRNRANKAQHAKNYVPHMRRMLALKVLFESGLPKDMCKMLWRYITKDEKNVVLKRVSRAVFIDAW